MKMDVLKNVIAYLLHKKAQKLKILCADWLQHKHTFAKQLITM